MNDVDMNLGDGDPSDHGTIAEIAATTVPGGSVLVGDLREFGVSASTLMVPPLTSTSASTSPSLGAQIPETAGVADAALQYPAVPGKKSFRCMKCKKVVLAKYFVFSGEDFRSQNCRRCTGNWADFAGGAGKWLVIRSAGAGLRFG